MAFYAYYPPDNITTATIVGPVTVNQGTTPWIVTQVADGTLKNYYAVISSVASGMLSTIQTYTVINATSLLYEVDVAGTNIADYTIILNGVTIDQKYTYFGGELNAEFNFRPGLKLVNGDVLQVKVIHSRPFVGDFNSKILVAEM
jgi:hypothetical protein